MIAIYVKQVFEGLAFLHLNDVIHRDIKGANLLVDMHGIVKLADFGASKKVSETLSTVKSIRGTPYWMAPEVIKQTGHGKQADIWSVGCTIVEMATGKPPWSEFNTHVSVLFHIASSTDPPKLPEHVCADAKDLLLECFKRNPAERPSCNECLAHPFVASAASPTPSAGAALAPNGGGNAATPPRAVPLHERVKPPAAIVTGEGASGSLSNVQSAAAAARAAMSPKHANSQLERGGSGRRDVAPNFVAPRGTPSSSPPPPANGRTSDVPPLHDSLNFDSLGSMFHADPSLWRESSSDFLASEASFARGDDPPALASPSSRPVSSQRLPKSAQSVAIDELRPPRRGSDGSVDAASNGGAAADEEQPSLAQRNLMFATPPRRMSRDELLPPGIKPTGNSVSVTNAGLRPRRIDPLPSQKGRLPMLPEATGDVLAQAPPPAVAGDGVPSLQNLGGGAAR